MRYNNNMKKQIFATALLAMMMPIAMLGQQVEATIHVTEGHQKIYKEIYGQFAEHLGTCIYGGHSAFLCCAGRVAALPTTTTGATA